MYIHRHRKKHDSTQQENHFSLLRKKVFADLLQGYETSGGELLEALEASNVIGLSHIKGSPERQAIQCLFDFERVNVFAPPRACWDENLPGWWLRACERNRSDVVSRMA